MLIGGFNVRGGSIPPATRAIETTIPLHIAFAFTGRGFVPGDQVVVTQMEPDSTVLPIENVTSDSNGSATNANVSFDTPGQHTLVARGAQSGVVVTRVYTAA